MMPLPAAVVVRDAADAALGGDAMFSPKFSLPRVNEEFTRALPRRKRLYAAVPS